MPLKKMYLIYLRVFLLNLDTRNRFYKYKTLMSHRSRDRSIHQVSECKACYICITDI